MGSFQRTNAKMDQLGFVRGSARLLAAPLTQAPPETIGDVIDLSGTSTDEVQSLAITGTPTGGTFRLTFRDVTTVPIAYNAAAAAVQAALEALSTVGSGGVACTGGPLPGAPVVITFGGNLAGESVPLISVTAALTGGTTPAAAVTRTTPGQGRFDPLDSWFDLGGTKTGIQVGYNDSDEEFTIDQETAIIGALPTSHDMWMQTALVEVTPERISFSWDMGDVTLNTSVTPAEKRMGYGTPTTRTQRRLAVVHRRAQTGLLRLHFLRIVQRSPLESTLTYAPTGDQQSVPLRLRGVIDTAVPDEDERFGYLLDQQAA